MSASGTSGIITAISALIGGTLAVFAGKLWESLDARKSERHFLATQYFCQLQFSAQALDDRLDNLLSKSGATIMDDQYRRVTTLYTFACPLALERIFVLDGVYSQIHNRYIKLGQKLRRLSLDGQLTGFNFHRYHRVALAECAIERDDSRLRLATYFEFRDRYEKAIAKNEEWIESAQVFADHITSEEYRERMQQIQDSLKSIARELVRFTKLESKGHRVFEFWGA
jgi:hypothetical protein